MKGLKGFIRRGGRKKTHSDSQDVESVVDEFIEDEKAENEDDEDDVVSVQLSHNMHNQTVCLMYSVYPHAYLYTHTHTHIYILTHTIAHCSLPRFPLKRKSGFLVKLIASLQKSNVPTVETTLFVTAGE